VNIVLVCKPPVDRFYSVAVITRDSDHRSLSRNPGSSPGRTSFSLGTETTQAGRLPLEQTFKGTHIFLSPTSNLCNCVDLSWEVLDLRSKQRGARYSVVTNQASSIRRGRLFEHCTTGYSSSSCIGQPQLQGDSPPSVSDFIS